MKIELVDFRGLVKWIVTKKTFFVDPEYLDEFKEALKNGKI